MACVPWFAIVNDDGDRLTPDAMPLIDAVHVTEALRVLFSVRGNVQVPTQNRFWKLATLSCDGLPPLAGLAAA